MKICNPHMLLCILLSVLQSINSLENGLALTPPMGWLSWERFKCNTNCKDDPENCISERLFMQMADRIVTEGYKDAGYLYVNIDDCWMTHHRDENGSMVADPERFPHGIKFLSDFMHVRGLRLGIYQDYGSHTCMGYPGSLGHLKQDADAFAKWDVDMVKLDGCYSLPIDLDQGYIEMGSWLNKTRKPMLFACSWPYYQLMNKMEPNYKSISTHCNLWRNYHDVQDSWTSIQQIMDFYGDNQEVLTPFIGPGRWSDPDMLLIGNYHLNPGQARTQMAVWCMIPGPLLMSNDLRKISSVFKEILLNKKAITVNQDALGYPGKRIYKKNQLEIWRRNILPKQDSETSFALLFCNRGIYKEELKMTLIELGLTSIQGYFIQSVFSDEYYGFVESKETLTISVSGRDVVMLTCQLKNNHL